MQAPKEMIPFSQSSSVISAYRYEQDARTLWLTFGHGDRVYRYLGVSLDELNELINAESPGRYFLAKIKPRKRCLAADVPDPLPEICAAYREDQVVFIRRDSGLLEEADQDVVPRDWNEARGITAAQVAAMIAGSSIDGWASKETDPGLYDEATAASWVYPAT